MAEERSAFEAKEDNYRVEVRDDDNKLIEAISKASDFRVSLAAWHAAIRARPGMRLVHLNNDHVMSVIDAPGKVHSIDGAPPRVTSALGAASTPGAPSPSAWANPAPSSRSR